MQYERKLKDWNCTKRKKSKSSKSVEMWFNAIGSTTSHEGAVIISFHSWYEEAAWPFWTYSLTGRQPYSLPLFPFPFLYASCLAKFNLFWILFLLSADENFLRQLQLVLPTNFAAYRPNLLGLDFSPNDPIGSRSNGGLFPRGETLFLFPLIIILELNLNSEIILRQLQNLS